MLCVSGHQITKILSSNHVCVNADLLTHLLAVQSAKKRKKSGGADAAEDTEAAAAAAPQSQSLTAESYTPPDPGPYPQDKPPENSVRFTPVQVCHLPVLLLRLPNILFTDLS